MTTPANTLTPNQTAGVVLLSDPTVGISMADYSAASSNEAIAVIVNAGNGTVGVRYVADGTADITVTRIADGSVRAHAVTCTGGTPPPPPPPADWDWELGTAV